MEINNDVLKITELMKKIQPIFVQGVSYFFILLFIYAAVSKLMDFENFQIQLAQSPIVSAYAGFISYTVIIAELIVAVLLIFSSTRLFALYSSMAIMMAFTIYIYLILNFSEFVPCSCGGILEKMGWKEHLIFNIVCVLLVIFSIIKTERKRNSLPVKYYIKILIILFISSISVSFLYFKSEYIIKKENNFTRKFLPHSIDYPKSINLQTNSFYFAGAKGDSLFLGNTTAPLLLGFITKDFKSFKIDTLSISDKTLNFTSVLLQVNYPYYSFTDGKIPVIFEGHFPEKIAQVVLKDKLYFSQILMTSSKNYIFRSHLREKNENVIGNVQLGNESPIKFNDKFLEKQIDGIFDTDGRLIKDPVTQENIYTYYYRNEYRRISNNLKFLGNGRTIDSTYKAQIEVATNTKGEKKMRKPPLKVNVLQVAYDGLLFNISNLKGRHESDDLWKSARIVDVYNYRDNSYLYSFPIYNQKNNKVRDIWVTNRYFYALIGNDIIKYKRMYKPR